MMSVGVIYETHHYTFLKEPMRYIQASPVHHVTRARKDILPATLFVTPAPAEPWSNVVSTSNWLRRCGVQNEQTEIEAPHGFLLFSPYQDRALDELERFFKRQL